MTNVTESGNMPRMSKSRLKAISMNDLIQNAIRAYCDAHGFVEAEWIRKTLCKEIGQPGLEETMTRGAPKKAGKKATAKKRRPKGN